MVPSAISRLLTLRESCLYDYGFREAMVQARVVGRFSSRMSALVARLSVRRALVFALLFAFAAQAQLAATHFHIAADPLEQALFGDSGEKGRAGDNKGPASDHCPITQLVASSHNFLAGTPTALPLPALVVDHVVAASEAPLVVQIIALNWQSRAPPCDISKA
jgi:hypothetical protein